MAKSDIESNIYLARCRMVGHGTIVLGFFKILGERPPEPDPPSQLPVANRNPKWGCIPVPGIVPIPIPVPGTMGQEFFCLKAKIDVQKISNIQTACLDDYAKR